MKNKLYYVCGPERHTKKGYWLFDFLEKDDFNIESFFLRKNDTETYLKYKSKYRLFKIIFKILFFAKKDDKILVYDNDTTGIYLGLVMNFFRPSMIVFKINCMANNVERLYSPIKRFFVRKAYQQIYTTVNNQEISNIFSVFLNLSKSHFIPIPDSFSDFGNDIMKISNRQDKGYIFMGGATHRDYNLFIETAKRLPEYHFVAVTFEKYRTLFENIPSNIEVRYGLPEKEFYQIIANCSLVFVPLLNNLQGGQLVLFQGALLKKTIVTTENTAIHTYFNEESVKLITIGDVEIAVKVLIEFMENTPLRIERGKAAYNDIIKFTPEEIYKQYKSKLFNVQASSS